MTKLTKCTNDRVPVCSSSLQRCDSLLGEVKIHFLFGNQQVTNALSKQVGISEAIRPLTYSNSTSLSQTCADPSDHWNQWLAGLVDGDGSLLVSPDGYTSCEITMDLRDEYALQQVKAKLGGSVKLRSGARAIRYRLHHRKGMEELIHRINGQIQLGARQKQLKILCAKLDIPYVEATKLSPKSENAWFAGFFDADGCITLSIKHGSPQVTIAASTKYAEDLIAFKEVFRGNVYPDKSTNTYKWSIQSKVDLLNFLEYIKKYPCRSSKKARMLLLPRFFEYKDARMYRAPCDSLQYKAWLKFMEKWKARL